MINLLIKFSNCPHSAGAGVILSPYTNCGPVSGQPFNNRCFNERRMGEKTALSQCSSNNILMTRYERILRGGAAACSNIAGRSQVYQRSLQIYVEAQGLSATFLQVKHSTF